MALLLLWVRILQMLGIINQDFGMMIHAVLQVMGILSKFIILIFVFMIAFGAALFSAEATEMRKVFNLSQMSETSILQFMREFLYSMFVMTFNEYGVQQLFQNAHDNGNIALSITMIGFKLVIVL